MNINKTIIEGAYIIERAIGGDERGYFSRVADIAELKNAGINADFVQYNLSRNTVKGVLRGLHSQVAGFAEDKLITCTNGEIYDVCVDVRKDSLTYGKYVGQILSEQNGKSLYIPKGCAHGYITLTDNAQALYFSTQVYAPNVEVGYNWKDPMFSIDWPIEPTIISKKDDSWTFVSER
ncbi:MAG: dTDP-4-dehydrorhamnose 3,5-epimerase [Clostridiales bacterium]|jgi:dTDP-4-dehydrorhamnose 3,5-epimerase|nr:dTDP-4-dehydrorhamnose 3,5-epimerase [Clostridiales bacterium]